MKPTLSQPVQKPVLPLTMKNGHWQVSQPPPRTLQAQISMRRVDQWMQKPPPPGVLWVTTVGAGFTMLTGAVTLIKSRMDIQAQQYKALLEGKDQGPLKVLTEATQRSEDKQNEPYDNDTLNTLEVQETSAKVNSALATMRKKGLLTTRMSKRLLAGNKLRLNRVVIENHDFSTQFHPLNTLKRVLYPNWWQRHNRMQAARKTPDPAGPA
jgi:hypothetical protein